MHDKEEHNNKEKQKNYPAYNSKRSEKTYLLYIISITIIIVLAYSFITLTRSYNPKTGLTLSHTTVSSINNTTIQNNIHTFVNPVLVKKFIKNYGANLNLTKKSGLFGKVISNHPQSNCNYTIFYTYYTTQQPSIITSNAINYSSFNKSKPLLLSFSVRIINSSNATAYISQFNKNKGYCNNIKNKIITNSTSYLSISKIHNLTVYTRKLSNLTNNALNLITIHYLGVRPNLYWYFSNALYKNTVVELTVWGFNGYQNNTYINNQYNRFLSSFINYINR